MTWPIWTGLMLCLLAVLAVGLSLVGGRRWAGSTKALLTRLEAARIDPDRIGQVLLHPEVHREGPAPPATRYDERELQGLPAPVQRYFRAVLKNGQPIIAAATIDMAGTFNMSPTGEQWQRFTSRQRVVTRRAGFLWDARISMFPGVAVRVVDSYIAGKGLLHATIMGLFEVASLQGEGEIARGEFMRWFAEVAWYPTALLPSQGVRWQAVDEHSAQATVTDGPLSLTLLFRFDDAGLMTSFRAEARGGMVGKTMVMAPWEGAWSNYRWQAGVQVPFTGEVAWMRRDGRKPYFIGTVTAMDLELAP
jgi:hypothetical protein